MSWLWWWRWRWLPSTLARKGGQGRGSQSHHPVFNTQGSPPLLKTPFPSQDSQKLPMNGTKATSDSFIKMQLNHLGFKMRECPHGQSMEPVPDSGSEVRSFTSAVGDSVFQGRNLPSFRPDHCMLVSFSPRNQGVLRKNSVSK